MHTCMQGVAMNNVQCEYYALCSMSIKTSMRCDQHTCGGETVSCRTLPLQHCLLSVSFAPADFAVLTLDAPAVPVKNTPALVSLPFLPISCAAGVELMQPSSAIAGGLLLLMLLNIARVALLSSRGRSSDPREREQALQMRITQWALQGFARLAPLLGAIAAMLYRRLSGLHPNDQLHAATPAYQTAQAVLMQDQPGSSTHLLQQCFRTKILKSCTATSKVYSCTIFKW